MGHRRHCHSRNFSSRGTASLYSDSSSIVGRASGGGIVIGGERIGYSREGLVRLDDNKVILHPRRESPRSGLVAGLLSGGISGGLSGGWNLPTSPTLSPNPTSRHGRSSRLDPRKPYMSGGYSDGGPDPLLYPGHPVHSPFDPVETLYMMSGALTPGSPKSPFSPMSPGSSFDPYNMDRPRMAYGPQASPHLNYHPPYVEDYVSDMSEENMLIEQGIMQREVEELFVMRDGIGFGYDPYDMYKDPYGGMRGGY